MKFNASKNTLQAELAHLVRVTEKKSTIPILSTVLIEADGDSIRLVTTDLDVALVTSCAAEVIEPGSAVLSAKKLFDVVRTLPDAEISFRREGNKKSDAGLTTITCAGSEFKMATQDKEHYPGIAKSPKKESARVSAKVLQALVERTVYAITQEESKYALNGALFIGEENTLRMVATNGHRLSLAEASGSSNHKVIVPKKALSEIALLAAALTKGKDSADSEVLFARDENHLFFHFGERLLISRMLAGQFPNYDLVIPKNNSNAVALATKEFAQGLIRVALMADDKSHGVKLKLSKGKLVITSQSPDVGEAKEELAVDYKGEPVEIGFNATYRLDFLNTIDTDKVVFALKDDQSPALFHPDGDEDYRYVVMPMRLL